MVSSEVVFFNWPNLSEEEIRKDDHFSITSFVPLFICLDLNQSYSVAENWPVEARASRTSTLSRAFIISTFLQPGRVLLIAILETWDLWVVTLRTFNRSDDEIRQRQGHLDKNPHRAILETCDLVRHYISDNWEQQSEHSFSPSIKSDTGQHSQFLVCFVCIFFYFCLKRRDVILPNIFWWKQGHLLPPWRPSSLRAHLSCSIQLCISISNQPDMSTFIS